MRRPTDWLVSRDDLARYIHEARVPQMRYAGGVPLRDILADLLEARQWIDVLETRIIGSLLMEPDTITTALAPAAVDVDAETRRTMAMMIGEGPFLLPLCTVCDNEMVAPYGVRSVCAECYEEARYMAGADL